MNFRSTRAAWLLIVLGLLLFAGAARAIDPADLLEPEKAFRLSARAVAPDLIEVRYDIAPGYYLYRERFKFENADAKATDGTEAKGAQGKALPAAKTGKTDPGLKLGAPQFPPGESHVDAFFGRMETYRKAVAVRIPVMGNPDRVQLAATSQGCADVGVCYPPNTQKVSVDMTVSSPAAGGGLLMPIPNSSVAIPGYGPASPVASASWAGGSDTDIAAMFESKNIALLLASFFGFGLLLAFTPCMLPMLPILSGIIVGESGAAQQGGKLRALALSAAYVLGMAAAYALAGVAAAYSGSLLAAALQNAWVLGAFALVFVVLALSMFGAYELQLPGFMRERIDMASRRVPGGRVASVALMGVLSAIIVSPCVAAPLAGAMLYIAQSREVFTGGAALFVMALGMGAPLLVVGVSEGALLPRAGAWMEAVKRLFGFLLLGVAIWIVSPVIPVAAQMLGWAALLIVGAMFMRAIDPLPADAPGVARVFKAVGVLALLAGVAMLAGMLAGSRDPLRPLAGVLGASAELPSEFKFERVKSVAELDARVASAGRPVMLDFYADWCVTCKEMERWTFSDPSVKARLGNVLVLQADVTANDADDKALLKRFRLFGPPGIVFFDRGGREVGNVRVIGYESAERFGRVLDAVSAL